jgi:hypothetical protein
VPLRATTGKTELIYRRILILCQIPSLSLLSNLPSLSLPVAWSTRVRVNEICQQDGVFTKVICALPPSQTRLKQGKLQVLWFKLSIKHLRERTFLWALSSILSRRGWKQSRTWMKRNRGILMWFLRWNCRRRLLNFQLEERIQFKIFFKGNNQKEKFLTSVSKF